MRISFIVAMSENRVIGIDGKLPWHLPNDLQHFKKLTVGKNILMGRKTFESIKQPLPHRQNFVLTNNREFVRSGVTCFHTKVEALNSGLEDLIVIGGEDTFRLFLPECQKIYLTLVHTSLLGDTHFPAFTGFNEVSCQFHDKDDRHCVAYSFFEYER